LRSWATSAWDYFEGAEEISDSVVWRPRLADAVAELRNGKTDGGEDVRGLDGAE